MPGFAEASKSIMKTELLGGKPQTAVTSWIDRACDPRIGEAEVVGILPELVAVINMQPTGPTEASRAVRKKLKYGDVKRQMRAVIVLESLVLNCGEKFQTTFANERLVERIKIMTQDPHTDASLKRRIMVMLGQWAKEFKDHPQMLLVAGLYAACGGGQARAAREARESYRREQERLENEERERRDRKHAEKVEKEEQRLRAKEEREKEKQRKKGAQPQRRAFSLEQEKPLVLQAVAAASQSANNLVNSLQLVNREDASVLTDSKVQDYLQKTKEARKKVVRYIQLVPDQDPDGEYLGTLLNVNEQVMAALQLYDRMSKPVELDSDDEEVARLAAAGKTRAGTDPTGNTDEFSSGPDDGASIRARVEAASLYDSRDGEVDKLQHRQRRAVMQHNSGNQAGGYGYGADLVGLDFGAANSGLQPPIQPHHQDSIQDLRSHQRGESGALTLSDYSDYDSSDGEIVPAHSRALPTSPALISGSAEARNSGTRAYDQLLGESEKEGVAGQGLLDTGADEGADPFADPEEEVAMPGVPGKRTTWAEI